MAVQNPITVAVNQVVPVDLSALTLDIDLEDETEDIVLSVSVDGIVQPPFLDRDAETLTVQGYMAGTTTITLTQESQTDTFAVTVTPLRIAEQMKDPDDAIIKFDRDIRLFGNGDFFAVPGTQTLAIKSGEATDIVSISGRNVTAQKDGRTVLLVGTNELDIVVDGDHGF